MKIVLYVNGFLPSVGGKELVVHHLATALGELGHAVRVLGPRGFFRHRKVRFAYPVHRWPGLHPASPELVLPAQLWLDMKIWGGDLIHAHNTYPCGYAAVRVARRLGVPLVITPHGADIQSIPHLGHGLRLDPEKDRKIREAVTHAALCTAISRNIEEELLACKVPPTRIRRIANGVDLPRFAKPHPPGIRHQLGLPDTARLMVSVGNYRPLKGQDHLVRAMPAILQAEPHAVLVVVGKGSHALQPLIDSLGVAHAVILAGVLYPPPSALVPMGGLTSEATQGDTLAELLHHSELSFSVGIDKNSEGLSLAVLESFAASVPVVATRISGNVDVVEDNSNGLLVEPDDPAPIAAAAVRVLRDTALQSRLKENARRTAERYSWRAIAESYVDVYREALALRNDASELVSDSQ